MVNGGVDREGRAHVVGLFFGLLNMILNFFPPAARGHANLLAFGRGLLRLLRFQLQGPLSVTNFTLDLAGRG